MEELKKHFYRLLQGTKAYFLELYREIRSLNKHNIKDFSKKRCKLLCIISLSILLVLGYSVGRIYTSKSNIISKLEVALKQGNYKDLSKIVRIDGKRVNGDKLKPYIDYFSESTMVDSLIKDIKTKGKGENLQLDYKNGLFIKSYYFELSTYNLKINSNFSEGSFSLGGKNKVTAGDTFNNVIPGIYNVKGTLETEYGQVLAEKEISVMKDEEIDINFNAVNISINSEYKDATVVVNGEVTEDTVENFKDKGPFPTDGSVELSIKKELPWGTFSSEKVKISDKTDVNLTLDIVNDKLWEETESKVNAFYKSVFKALNEEDKNEITNSTVEVKDKIYDILEKDYFFFRNKYEITNMEIQKEQSEFSCKDGIYRGTIVVEVNYNTSKKILGLNKSSNVKSFFTKVVYEKNQWIIEDVENFSL